MSDKRPKTLSEQWRDWWASDRSAPCPERTPPEDEPWASAPLTADERFQADTDRVLAKVSGGKPGALYLVSPDAVPITDEPEFEAEWRKRVANGANPGHLFVFIPHSH